MKWLMIGVLLVGILSGYYLNNLTIEHATGYRVTEDDIVTKRDNFAGYTIGDMSTITAVDKSSSFSCLTGINITK